MRFLLLSVLVGLLFFSCKEESVDPTPQLVFKFKFDPNQARLDNFGEPSVIPVGHAAQTPDFNAISANYIELARQHLTLLGDGEIVYEGAETTAGGDEAIDFSKAIIVEEGEVFLSIPLSEVEAATYEWVRVSLSYQNYVVLMDAEVNTINFTDIPCTIASFVGYNNYITSYKVDEETIVVNGNKLQGYAGIETDWTLDEVQAPPGSTTVPNPLFDSSPIPSGSCVVTGEIENGLVITGQETKDIVVELSVSINNSFEWVDGNGNDKYEPLLNEIVVDMGLRGLIPSVL